MFPPIAKGFPLFSRVRQRLLLMCNACVAEIVHDLDRLQQWARGRAAQFIANRLEYARQRRRIVHREIKGLHAQSKRRRASLVYQCFVDIARQFRVMAVHS